MKFLSICSFFFILLMFSVMLFLMSLFINSYSVFYWMGAFII